MLTRQTYTTTTIAGRRLDSYDVKALQKIQDTTGESSAAVLRRVEDLLDAVPGLTIDEAIIGTQGRWTPDRTRRTFGR